MNNEPKFSYRIAKLRINFVYELLDMLSYAFIFSALYVGWIYAFDLPDRALVIYGVSFITGFIISIFVNALVGSSKNVFSLKVFAMQIIASLINVIVFEFHIIEAIFNEFAYIHAVLVLGMVKFIFFLIKVAFGGKLL